MVLNDSFYVPHVCDNRKISRLAARADRKESCPLRSLPLSASSHIVVAMCVMQAIEWEDSRGKRRRWSWDAIKECFCIPNTQLLLCMDCKLASSAGLCMSKGSEDHSFFHPFFPASFAFDCITLSVRFLPRCVCMQNRMSQKAKDKGEVI